jgi:hypothetical protein
MKYFMVHVNAGNDQSGNPRRGWILYRVIPWETADGTTWHGTAIVDFFDEGYDGDEAIPPRYRRYPTTGQIRVTPKAYREFIRLGARGRIVDRVERLMEKAAKAWEIGQNSGNSAIAKRENQKCDALRQKAAKLLPTSVKVDFPGLYPRYRVGDRDCSSLAFALSLIGK